MAHRDNLIANLTAQIDAAAADDDVITALQRTLAALDSDLPAAAVVACLIEMEGIIQAKNLGGFAGPKYVTETLFDLALAGSGHHVAGGPAKRIERLSANNPLRLLPDGTLADWEHATSNDYFELQAHHALLNPRKRGRPAGTRPSATKPRKRRIPEECSRDTATMKLPQWTAKWAAELDITDKRQYEQARGRFNSARVNLRLLQKAAEKK